MSEAKVDVENVSSAAMSASAVEPELEESETLYADAPGAEGAAATAVTDVAARQGVQLAKIAGAHAMFLLLVFSMFAAADSWAVITGLGLASVLSAITAVLAGVTLATLIHEWFHYVGARYSGGAFNIPRKLGLFVFDWRFDKNTVEQFVTMSIAGSIGGAVAVFLLWNSVPTDTLGRAALLASAVAAFIYAAIVEWPVLKRTKLSREPLAELSKIDQKVLTRAGIGALVTVFIMTPFFLD